MNFLTITSNVTTQPPQLQLRKYNKQQELNMNSLKNAEVNSLDNPMDTIGRSQVNFKSKYLSSNDLNYIAQRINKLNLNHDEIKIFKSAVLATMKDYKLKKVQEIAKVFGKGCDDAVDITEKFVKNVCKFNKGEENTKITDAFFNII